MHTHTTFPRIPVKNAPLLAVLFLALCLLSPTMSATAQTGSEPTDEMYAEMVENIIMKKWQNPQEAKGKKLACRVQISISAEGQLTKAKLVKSSGMKVFDKSAMDTVAQVTDLPAPPATVGPCEMVLVFSTQ
ncbi:MAG: TonB C-terminal domain-containing protein [Desulfovibrio sp.]|nr:TonB C-terminal domain-containing protein [Desulfovibrio sp.]MBI4961214.1 TonB C-terminal domain-containing protein [Desulfovibrio sp.]